MARKLPPESTTIWVAEGRACAVPSLRGVGATAVGGEAWAARGGRAVRNRRMVVAARRRSMGSAEPRATSASAVSASVSQRATRVGSSGSSVGLSASMEQPYLTARAAPRGRARMTSKCRTNPVDRVHKSPVVGVRRMLATPYAAAARATVLRAGRWVQWAGQDSNLRGALPRECITGTLLRPLGHRPGVVNGSGGIRTRMWSCDHGRS